VRALLFAALVVGCGARTSLPIPELDDASLPSNDVSDAPVPCTPGRITLERARPAVMMVLDRSGSMGRGFGGVETRWSILTRALASALPPVDSTMSLGALMFPRRGGGQTCALPTTPELTPALGNVDELLAEMRKSKPRGGTPTAAAIELASKTILAHRAATTARAMVLATDGAPVCNSALDPRTCRCGSSELSCTGRPDLCLDDARTINALRATLAKGVPTYVIGIAATEEGGFPDVLDAMAVAGGRPKLTGPSRYYGADSEAELDEALVAIRDQVGACTYLTVSVPDAAGDLTLLINGVAVPYDESGTNGWSWVDRANGQIALAGAACTRAQPSGARIEAVVACSDSP
jgi:hypothetical protein